MDSDERPDQDGPPVSELGEGDQGNAGQPSDAAPAAVGDEATAAGPAPSDDEPAASDAYGYDDALVGDWAHPDVDLSHLTPTDDGDPDDDPEPVETVSQVATGQALIMPFSNVVAEAANEDDTTEPTA